MRASDDVVAQIRRAFFEGMRPGDRVGTELELAAQFGVSRVTIRDAIRTLEVQGVIEVKVGAGGGLRIATPDPDRFADALAVQLHLAGVSRHEVVEAMQTVEPLTARLAAHRADPSDRDRMREALNEADTHRDEPRAFTEAALDLHLIIAEASHNRALRASVRALRSVQELTFEPDTSRDRAEGVGAAHQRIVDAIVAQDADAAEVAMRSHLDALSRHRSDVASAAAYESRPD